MKGDSLKLTEQKDLFLYRRIDRREKSESSTSGSSTHTSASGKTHGGANGSFRIVHHSIREDCFIRALAMKNSPR